MIAFVLCAVALVAFVLALLLRPWWRRPPEAGPGADALNLRVLRDQRDELRRDRDAGLIGGNEAEAAEGEIERRLLDERQEAAATAAATTSRGGGPVPWALVVALPLAASLGYAWRGHPEAMDAASLHAAAPIAASAAASSPEAAGSAPGMPDVDAMVARLRTRLAEHPDDPAGWTMLARAERAMGRAQAASEAFGHIGAPLQQDATLLAEYADTRAALNGARLDAAASAALARARKLEPDNPMALSLAATMEFNAKDLDAAARDWEHLLRVLPENSADAAMVRAYLKRTGHAPAASAPR